MGRSLAETYPAARAVFEEVDEALGEKLSALIWEGDAETLTLTQNAQPALMATSLAAMAALDAEGVGVETAAFVAGHSLGEYSALCAAGALSVADAARLLRIRGLAMQQAVPAGGGAMAAVLGLDMSGVKKLVDAAAMGDCLSAANDNDPNQVVISGVRDAVERAVGLAKEHGAKRAMLLQVSAPFHCALMEPAVAPMMDALDKVDIATPKVPVVVNVHARPETDPAQIRANLIDQITGSVRWRESVAWMAAEGVQEFVEVGSGKALIGMVRRIAKVATLRAVNAPADVRDLVASMLGGGRALPA